MSAKIITVMSSQPATATLNKLGELNEQRKAFAKSLQYYQRSLKAEWNPPPTMHAVQRLQKEIGQVGAK